MNSTTTTSSKPQRGKKRKLSKAEKTRRYQKHQGEANRIPDVAWKSRSDSVNISARRSGAMDRMFDDDEYLRRLACWKSHRLTPLPPGVIGNKLDVELKERVVQELMNSTL